MRTFTTEHTVYTFDELSQEAQEKVLEHFRLNEDFLFLEDNLQCQLDELLADNKITYDTQPRLNYSLSYCQGDGAMFEGTVYWKQYTVEIKQSGHYSHYNSKQLDIWLTNSDYEDVPEEVYNEFNNVYVTICKQLEKSGYAEIEDTLSDENLIDNIKANEYEFTAEGILS